MEKDSIIIKIEEDIESESHKYVFKLLIYENANDFKIRIANNQMIWNLNTKFVDLKMENWATFSNINELVDFVYSCFSTKKYRISIDKNNDLSLIFYLKNSNSETAKEFKFKLNPVFEEKEYVKLEKRVKELENVVVSLNDNIVELKAFYSNEIEDLKKNYEVSMKEIQSLQALKDSKLNSNNNSFQTNNKTFFNINNDRIDFTNSNKTITKKGVNGFVGVFINNPVLISKGFTSEFKIRIDECSQNGCKIRIGYVTDISDFGENGFHTKKGAHLNLNNMEYFDNIGNTNGWILSDKITVKKGDVIICSRTGGISFYYNGKKINDITYSADDAIEYPFVDLCYQGDSISLI